MMNKKAQEEIVGFVAIVLIVSVVIIIILGASLKESNHDRKNVVLSHYVQSLTQFTTECTSYGSNYRDVADLIRDCHNRRKCSSSEDSCKVLNKTLTSIFNSTLTYGGNYSNKGYIFLAQYDYGASKEKIAYLSFGNCSGDYTKADLSFADLPGMITVSMQECY